MLVTLSPVSCVGLHCPTREPLSHVWLRASDAQPAQTGMKCFGCKIHIRFGGLSAPNAEYLMANFSSWIYRVKSDINFTRFFSKFLRKRGCLHVVGACVYFYCSGLV